MNATKETTMTNESDNEASVGELADRIALLERRLAAPPRRWPWTRVTSIVLGLAGLLAVGQTVFAADPAPPSFVPYRGTIEQDGAPLHQPSGVPMVFTLYDSQAGMTTVGSPYSATVPVVDGVFSVQIPLGATTLRKNEVWLAMTVNGNPLTGRQRLLAVPYAARATEALMATANGVPAGALMMFTTGCPEGWSEYTPAYGRYLVGAQPGWGLAAPVGSAIVDLEMAHNHTAAHNHTVPTTAAPTIYYLGWRTNADTQSIWNGCGASWGGCSGGVVGNPYLTVGSWEGTAVTALHNHTVPDTNATTAVTSATKTYQIAPFLTVRVCQKL